MARRRTHTETWWANAGPAVLRCTASLKGDGSRCRAEAHPGTTVCGQHGALAPAVLAAAATRVQMSVDEAAAHLVAWMNDPSVDMRERVRIATDLLDRGGLGATSKVLVGVTPGDKIEQLFLDIASDPQGTYDPRAVPQTVQSTQIREYNELADPQALAEGDVVAGELVEQPEEPARLPSPEPEERVLVLLPKHIREGLERAEELRRLL